MGVWPTWAESRRRRDRAIELRRQGMSYKQIRAVIGGSMASLSKWLRDIPLTDLQRAGLRRRRLEAVRKTARANHERRPAREAQIKRTTTADIGRMTQRDLFVAGVVAYAAEGAKKKTLAEEQVRDVHELGPADDRAFSSLAVARGN